MHYFARLKRSFFLVGLLLVLTQSGCTIGMWQAATRDTRNYRGITGRVGGEAKGGSQLVLVYDGSNVSESHVLLPLDEDGAPPPLFLYTGKRKTVDGIATELSEQRLRQIQDYVFDENSKLSAQKGMKSSNYAAFTYPPVSGWPIYWYYSPHMDLVMVALGPDGVPRMATEIKTKDGQTRYRFPDDCRIVILPGHQPRTPRELHTSTALAVMLTPVTVASDIVLVPIAFFVAILTGNVC